jgi:hypothetical protein
LEATQLLPRYFGAVDANCLYHYSFELQLGLAELPEGADFVTHLQQLFESARS